MSECQCDPDVWGPDGLEGGTGHNPICPNFEADHPDLYPFDEGMKRQCRFTIWWQQCRLDHGHDGMHSPGRLPARSTPAEALDAETLARLWREEEVTDLDVDCPKVDYEATGAAVMDRLGAAPRAEGLDRGSHAYIFDCGNCGGRSAALIPCDVSLDVQTLARAFDEHPGPVRASDNIAHDRGHHGDECWQQVVARLSRPSDEREGDPR